MKHSHHSRQLTTQREAINSIHDDDDADGDQGACRLSAAAAAAGRMQA